MRSERPAGREAPDPSSGLRWKLHLTTALASLYVFAWWAMASSSPEWPRDGAADREPAPVALAPTPAPAPAPVEPAAVTPAAPAPVIAPLPPAQPPTVTRVASARRHRVRTRSS